MNNLSIQFQKEAEYLIELEKLYSIQYQLITNMGRIKVSKEIFLNTKYYNFFHKDDNGNFNQWETKMYPSKEEGILFIDGSLNL